MWILLLLIGVALLLSTSREFFTEADPTLVIAKRPQEWPTGMRSEQYRDTAWLSRIDAQAPFNPNYRDYILAIQQFYDTVYDPASSRPKDTDVEAFVQSVTGLQVNKDALRQILIAAFDVDTTTTAAAREEKQQKFQPSEALFPQEGVLEVWKNLQIRGLYTPADSSPPVSSQEPMPEGVYTPIPPVFAPRREGQGIDKSTSWTAVSPYTICQSGPCAENIV